MRTTFAACICVTAAATGGILSSGVRRSASSSRVWVKVEEVGP